MTGTRHSFGPFSTELEAAQKVQQFFQQASQGSAALTRGQKRAEKFDTDFKAQIEVLNQTAKQESRHILEIGDVFSMHALPKGGSQILCTEVRKSFMPKITYCC